MSSEIPCPPPRVEATPPLIRLPEGACDTHAHVFGPAERYPYQPSRDYTPPDAPPEALFAVHETLGISRCVLTQPSVLGTDNSLVLDAVACYPEKLRAVVAFGSDVDENELDRLHAAGARGLRLNLVDKGGMPFDNIEGLNRVADQIGERGWHVELLAKAHLVGEMAGALEALPTSFSLGHFGYMPVGRGVDDPGFQWLLEQMREGRAFVKMTGGYRITEQKATPYSDIRPFAEALLATAPEQVLWGSDWPHVMCRIDMPDDGVMLDEVLAWIGDDTALLQKVFVDNPARLYGFAGDQVTR